MELPITLLPAEPPTERPTDAELLAVLSEHFDESPATVARWLVDMDQAAALRDYCTQLGIALEH